jgi:hypothetical protein
VTEEASLSLDFLTFQRTVILLPSMEYNKFTPINEDEDLDGQVEFEGLQADNSGGFAQLSSTSSPVDSQGFSASATFDNSVSNIHNELVNIIARLEDPALPNDDTGRNYSTIDKPNKEIHSRIGSNVIIAAMDVYLKVGISSESTTGDEKLEKIIDGCLEKIRAQRQGEEIITEWLQLIQSGARHLISFFEEVDPNLLIFRMQYAIFTEVEKFVNEYSSYLSRFDLAFGCMPAEVPAWAMAQVLEPSDSSGSTTPPDASVEKQRKSRTEEKRRANLNATQQDLLFVRELLVYTTLIDLFLELASGKYEQSLPWKE